MALALTGPGYLSDLFKLTVYRRNCLLVLLAVTGKYVVSRNFFVSCTLWYRLEVDLLSCKVGDIGSEVAELGGEKTCIPFLVKAFILILLKRNNTQPIKIINHSLAT